MKRLLLIFRRGIVYWLPLFVLLAATAARLLIPGVLDRLALPAFDIYQQLQPREASDDAPVVIVDIDEHSLKQLGQWPWPRTAVAQIVENLGKAGAAVIAFDVLFTEPDRTSPQALLALLTERGVGEEEAKRLLGSMPDPDTQLAAAMAKYPVVVGFNLTMASGRGNPLDKAGFSWIGQPGLDPLRYVKNFPEAVAALPQFQKAAAGIGFVNQLSDWDNVVRRVPLILQLRNHQSPSLAAEAMRVGFGAKGYKVKYAGANNEGNQGENTGINHIEIQNPDGVTVAIPTDRAGQVTLHYPKRDQRWMDAHYISAADIYAGKFDKARIADHVILVGSSASGLNDLKATPVASDVPGVELHAHLIEQVLQQSFLYRPDWGVGAEILFAVFVGIIVIVTIPLVGALPSAGVGGIATVAAIAASWFAFKNGQMLIDPVYPIAVLATVYLIGTLLNYRMTEQRQAAIRNMFGTYVSRELVEQLAADPEKLVLGGEIRLMTIMFCDIRGFTTMSEGMNSHELGQLINEFLTPMTDIIMAHKGTIDKYIGDCIMAFWNAPLDDPEHARNAVAAAQDMRAKLVELNTAWAAEGRRTIHIGIGVNTGECSVGNFGSEQRFNYSLLGDPVNLASRLEGQTKAYGVDLIIGEDTAGRIDDPNLVELDLIAVKGKSKAVRIYTLPPHLVEAQQYLQRHAALLAAYRRRDWEAALSLLEDPVLAAEREMAPLYGMFRERIAQMRLEPPPEDWDGVFVAHEK